MIYQGEFELNNNNNDSNIVYNKVYPKDVHALLFLVLNNNWKYLYGKTSIKQSPN